MSKLVVAPLSVSDTINVSKSVSLELSEQRAAIVANAVAHIRGVVAKLDELPWDETRSPAFQFSTVKEK